MTEFWWRRKDLVLWRASASLEICSKEVRERMTKPSTPKVIFHATDKFDQLTAEVGRRERRDTRTRVFHVWHAGKISLSARVGGARARTEWMEGSRVVQAREKFKRFELLREADDQKLELGEEIEGELNWEDRRDQR